MVGNNKTGFYFIFSLFLFAYGCKFPNKKDIEGTWNIHDIIAKDSRYSKRALGLYSNLTCSFPTEYPDPASFIDGYWERKYSDGKVYLIFKTNNVFFNDTFTIDYYKKRGLYRTLILSNRNKLLLLKRYPPPTDYNPIPDDEWPKEFLEKK